MLSNGHAHSNGNGYGYRPVELADILLDRRVPHNIEAELSVLGGVILDGSQFEDVRAIVRMLDFFRHTHQLIWSAICDLADDGKPIDFISVADELERRGQFEAVGGIDGLSRLRESAGTGVNTVYHAQIVREKSKARLAIEISEETRDAFLRGDRTADEVISFAGERFSSIEPLCDEEETKPLLRPWPDPLDEAVYYGLSGEILRAISPESETDPAAILGQFLVAFGNVIGRNAHWKVERTRHYTNLYLCVVGESSKARKGTSWEHILWLMEQCDPEWVEKRIHKGMSTGEGLIYQVRDAIFIRRKAKDTGKYEEDEIDEGEKDKRALWVESEFGSILNIMSRDGNSLTGKVREGFDDGNMRSATKNSPLRATRAHVSIIGHVTSEELRLRLTRNDAANGFANRFLWLMARRQRYLPNGGNIESIDFNRIVNTLRASIQAAKTNDFIYPMTRELDAEKLWRDVYPSLSTGRPGLLGAVTSRAEALVMRVASLYALLERSMTIRLPHLEAGLAFWRYCDQSAAHVFGDALGDDDAEKLLKFIVASGDAGLTQTQIRREVFSGNKKALARLDEIVALLVRGGLIFETKRSAGTSGGRPVTVWKKASLGMG